jgi:hypothetical protein
MVIHTFTTSIPRSSESLQVFPMENEPFVFSFDLWMEPVPSLASENCLNSLDKER